MAAFKGGKPVITNWAPNRVIAMVTQQASIHLHAVGRFVVREAKSKVAVDKGTVRDNISYTVVRDGKNYVAWVGVKRPAFHAYILEVGSGAHNMKSKRGSTQTRSLTDTIDWFGKPANVSHPGTAAQPYLRPAVYGNAKKIVKIFETGQE